MTGPDGISFAVVGAGALGGYYGARLVRAGYAVRFLCHSDGAYVREHGLTVETGGERWRLKVEAYDRPCDMPPADVALVCLKTTANQRLPELLPPMLKPDGVAVLLQNGLEEESRAAGVVGPDRVYGGLCFLCANKVGPGHVIHLDYGRIVLGRYRPGGASGGVTPVMERLADAFDRAGIPVSCTDNLREARWRKLVWNIPYNGLSVVLRAETDALMAHPGIRTEVCALMDEVRALAEGEGYAIPVEFRDQMLADTARMQPYKTSMMLDYERGKPMEVDAIYRDPLSAGKRNGVAAPKIAQLAAMLDFLASIRLRSPPRGARRPPP